MGLAHDGLSTHAQGTGGSGGLTDRGQALLKEMKEVGMVWDVTHLADESFWQAVELFKESQNRVYSMALIHEKLYQSASMARIDLPEYIRTLTANLFLSYGVTGGAIRSKIQVENISLDIDTAIPCALIINELVSNALKHAFPGRKREDGTGEICVALRRDTGNKFILTVSDNGIGLPEGFDIQRCESLGLKLVGVLARQLKGTVHVGTGGRTEFVMSFAAKSGEGD